MEAGPGRNTSTSIRLATVRRTHSSVEFPWLMSVYQLSSGRRLLRRTIRAGTTDNSTSREPPVSVGVLLRMLVRALYLLRQFAACTQHCFPGRNGSS